jgi:hypothetical protein
MVSGLQNNGVRPALLHPPSQGELVRFEVIDHPDYWQQWPGQRNEKTPLCGSQDKSGLNTLPCGVKLINLKVGM